MAKPSPSSVSLPLATGTFVRLPSVVPDGFTAVVGLPLKSVIFVVPLKVRVSWVWPTVFEV